MESESSVVVKPRIVADVIFYVHDFYTGEKFAINLVDYINHYISADKVKIEYYEERGEIYTIVIRESFAEFEKILNEAINANNRIIGEYIPIKKNTSNDYLEDEINKYWDSLPESSLYRPQWEHFVEHAKHFAEWQKRQNEIWLEKNRKSIHDEGYKEGYDEGYKEGYHEGFIDG